MAQSNFLTDRFSTIGGLASVAYGSSSLFPTVADQLKRSSRTRALDSQIPSHSFLDFIGTQEFLKDLMLEVIMTEYSLGGDVTDFVDLYTNGIDEFSELFTRIFIQSLDQYSTYSVSPSKIISDSIEKTTQRFTSLSAVPIDFVSLTEKLIQKFFDSEYLAEDIPVFLAILANNPNTKVTEAPPDSLVQLDVQGVSSKDHRGVERNFGTISPRDYYNGAAYAPTGNLLKKAVVQGYVGYPLVSLLGESLLNQDSYENLDLNSVGASVLGSISTNPNLSSEEEAIYNINLATIDLGAN